MVIQYKCPDCGADMTYSPQTGTLSCASCGKSLSIEDYKEEAEEPILDFEEFESQTSAGTFGEEAIQYQCENCGAILITDGDTTATTCSFCGASMVLGDRLSGDLAPAKVIPFSINKEQAETAFRKWCKNGLLAPKGFASAQRIKNITGMYVPFWLYDLNGRGEAHADCTRTRTYESGDYIYTETRHYDVYRKVDLNYDGIPTDASEKMNDNLMDKLEPFHYDDLKDFKTPYLAGYLAEKYNYTDKELFPRVKERVDHYVNDYIRSTIHGYSSTLITSEWSDVKQRNASYTLLPIWMICYDYKDSEHIFAMNGQTGKIVGTPPLSWNKVIAWFAGISGGVFLLLEILYLISGGVLW
ncbi:MAG: TFIIB-type zinc ribbon-containing protein [Acetivibrio sp.]